MSTSLSVQEVRGQLGQDEPQNHEQEISLRIWERLPDEWLPEEEFLGRLREVAGLEDWQGADLSALFAGLHDAHYIQVVRADQSLQREVRRSPERPRFFSFQEQADNDAADMRVFQREQKDKELERAEEARRELEAPARAAEREQVWEDIDAHPGVIALKADIADLETENRHLRSRLARLELGGTTEETEPASAGR